MDRTGFQTGVMKIIKKSPFSELIKSIISIPFNDQIIYSMLELTSYKSSVKKLATFFHKSRDNWKEKYMPNKKKSIELENKVSSLKLSTQKWKSEALLLRKQIKNTITQTVNILPKPNINSGFIISYAPLKVAKIPYHLYSATTIYIMLQLVLSAAVSLRGSSRVLDIFNSSLRQPLDHVPSWFSVRSWLLRVGYYKLMRSKTIADDWCWIIDHTIQLGKTKCLLILGIRLSQLPKGRSLQYQDLEPIDLLPVETSTGDIVWKQLEKTALRTGTPRAIVSDAGSDLESGIAKFRIHHPECASLYDIKHKTACLLKAELTRDADWQVFMQQAAKTKKQLQQTSLSHLKPPNQRSKSRYMNIEILLRWAIETLKLLANVKDFNEAERQQLHKLEWLKSYSDKLQEWDEMLQVSILTEKSVRHDGITREGYQILELKFKNELPELKYVPGLKLKNDLIDFVKIQGEVCNDNEVLLGSSEIIESVFGKQKYLERDYAKEGFTSLILGIGSFVGTITVNIDDLS
jgi:hypothetical protein